MLIYNSFRSFASGVVLNDEVVVHVGIELEVERVDVPRLLVHQVLLVLPEAFNLHARELLPLVPDDVVLFLSTAGEVASSLAIALHLGHDLRLVGRVSKKCEDSFHAVSVVGLYYVIFLQRTQLQSLLTEALSELVIVVVELLELVVDHLHVFRVVEVDVHLLAVFLFGLLRASGLISLIIVLDDIGKTSDAATLFVCLQDAQLLRNGVSIREATKELSQSGIFPVESVEVVEDLLLGHISEL